VLSHELGSSGRSVAEESPPMLQWDTMSTLPYSSSACGQHGRDDDHGNIASALGTTARMTSPTLGQAFVVDGYAQQSDDLLHHHHHYHHGAPQGEETERSET